MVMRKHRIHMHMHRISHSLRLLCKRQHAKEPTSYNKATLMCVMHFNAFDKLVENVCHIFGIISFSLCVSFSLARAVAVWICEYKFVHAFLCVWCVRDAAIKWQIDINYGWWIKIISVAFVWSLQVVWETAKRTKNSENYILIVWCFLFCRSVFFFIFGGAIEIIVLSGYAVSTFHFTLSLAICMFVCACISFCNWNCDCLLFDFLRMAFHFYASQNTPK